MKMYAVADKTKGKNGCTVYYGGFYVTTFPSKTWKTRRGAENYIKNFPIAHTAEKCLEVVEVN
jgi:hypothetical protein